MWCTSNIQKKNAFEVAVILMWCASILWRTSHQSCCYCNVMLSHVSCCRSPFANLIFKFAVIVAWCTYIHPIRNFPSKLLLLPWDVRSSHKKLPPEAAVIAMWCTFILRRISLQSCSCDAVYIHPVQKFLYRYGIWKFILILDLPCNDQFTSSTHKIWQRLSVHTLQAKSMKRIMINLTMEVYTESCQINLICTCTDQI